MSGVDDMSFVFINPFRSATRFGDIYKHLSCQALYCLLTVISVQSIVKMKTFTRNLQNYPDDKDGSTVHAKFTSIFG